MDSRRARSWAAPCALSWTMMLGACTPQPTLPGTALGTYNVTGTLGTNTCGSGVNASNPWTFSVLLSKDGTTLYWANTDGTGEFSGPLSSNTVALTSTQTANVDATEAGPGTCYLQTTATITLDLASGSPPTGFTGTIAYAFAVSTSISSVTNCGDQLSSAGGPYDTLPCGLNYTITASRQ